MSEYIARPSLMAKLTSSETQHAMREMDGSQAYNLFLSLLNAETAADVAEVKHGRWISFLDGDHIMPERYYRCSKCGRVEGQKEPYCHCGAKMDGKGEGE